MGNDRAYRRKGLGRVLGSLESRIMEVLWTTGGGTGKEVYRAVRSTREVALTTVLTVLERLVKKGLVEKVKTDNLYEFRPAMAREDFFRSVSREVLQTVAELSSSALIASFVDLLAEKDPGELDRLSKLVNKKLVEIERDS